MNFDSIFFIGRSGAGKGTQAKILSERLGFFYWEMGAIVRSEIASQTELGKQIASLVNAGTWLAQEQMQPIIEKHLGEIAHVKGIVFDGIPRRIEQAEFVLQILKGLGKTRFLTLFIDLPREVAKERMLTRAGLEHRKDDVPEAIEKRLNAFEEESDKVVEFLKKETSFFTIDGSLDIDHVRINIEKVLALI